MEGKETITPRGSSGDSRARMSKPRATPKQVAAALIACGGVISLTAQRLGVARRSLEQRIQRSKTLQAARDEARDAVTDIAEAKLIQRINKGDTAAITFYLRCQGKRRGWILNPEVQINAPVQNNVVAQIQAGPVVTMDDIREELRALRESAEREQAEAAAQAHAITAPTPRTDDAGDDTGS